MESYAVVWTDDLDGVRAGKLELRPECLRLDGAEERRVPYGEVEGVHVGRRVAERLRGRPSLVLDLAGGRHLRVGSVGGPGTLHELAERLWLLTVGTRPEGTRGSKLRSCTRSR